MKTHQLKSTIEIMLNSADNVTTLSYKEKLALKNAINTVYDFLGDPQDREFLMDVILHTEDYAKKVKKLCAIFSMSLIPYLCMIMDDADEKKTKDMSFEIGAVFARALETGLKTWAGKTKEKMKEN